MVRPKSTSCDIDQKIHIPWIDGRQLEKAMRMLNSDKQFAWHFVN